MQARIQKWGNSLGVRIPMHLVKQLKLHENSPISIEIEGNRIVIQPPRYDLRQMLDTITPENLHREIPDDLPRGNEEW